MNTGDIRACFALLVGAVAMLAMLVWIDRQPPRRR
jgi:hypothetical protein